VGLPLPLISYAAAEEIAQSGEMHLEKAAPHFYNERQQTIILAHPQTPSERISFLPQEKGR